MHFLPGSFSKNVSHLNVQKSIQLRHQIPSWNPIPNYFTLEEMVKVLEYILYFVPNRGCRSVLILLKQSCQDVAVAFLIFLFKSAMINYLVSLRQVGPIHIITFHGNLLQTHTGVFLRRNRWFSSRWTCLWDNFCCCCDNVLF